MKGIKKVDLLSVLKLVLVLVLKDFLQLKTLVLKDYSF